MLCLTITSVKQDCRLTNKDSFDRLSEAKERQSYQGLNEPGTTLLSFAFATVEDNPEAWKSQPTSARPVKHRACSWIERSQPVAKAPGVGPEHPLELGAEAGQDRGVDAGADFRTGVVREVAMRSGLSERRCPG